MVRWPWGKQNREDPQQECKHGGTTADIGNDRRAVFERLVETQGRDFYGAALRITRNRDDANDLVQDTLLRAYAAFETFTPDTNFRAWVLQILTNNYLMLYRRRRLVTFVGWEDCAEANEGWLEETRCAWNEEPDTALLHDAMDADLEAALSRLSEGVRLVVLLVDVEELSYEEVAIGLGIPIGTVRSRLNRGREQMRRNLTDYAAEYRLITSPASPPCPPHLRQEGYGLRSWERNGDGIPSSESEANGSV